MKRVLSVLSAALPVAVLCALIAASGRVGVDSVRASAVADPDAWSLVLVNEEHPLEREYRVELAPVGDVELDARAADAANRMLAAAARDGVELVTISGHRSFEHSRQIFEDKIREFRNSGYSADAAREEAAKWIALPGRSEHHTGLALDVVSRDYYSQYGRYLDTPFCEYEGYRWLVGHCAEYGFILRYPADKEEVTGIRFEPWHFRYVGVGHAKSIMERGITLEEYGMGETA